MTLNKFFGDFLGPFFLDLIFPRAQLVLELEKMKVDDVLRDLPLCTDKSGLIPAMRDMTVVFKYRDRRVRQMIRELKYKGNKKVARLCGEILYRVILGEKLLPAILIPVPLTRERRRERGFNQNELVIKEIISTQNKNKQNNFSFSFDALQKIRHTLPQSSIKNRTERLKNLNGCFSVPHPKLVQGKNIILIDDVTTTGSTLAEARAVLLKAGAHTVNAVAIAH